MNCEFYFQLFLFFIVAICQCYLVPEDNPHIARSKIAELNNDVPLGRIGPNSGHLIPYHPVDYQQVRMTAPVSLHQFAPNAREDRIVQIGTRSQYLAEIDRDALNKVSETDRKVLLSELTQADREALLTDLADGRLDEILPRDESRFGLAGAAAQIGAGAGGYIGGKLAGALGAKLGAAVGSYLGAAAVNRLDIFRNRSGGQDWVGNRANPGLQYGGYGATLVRNK